MGRGGADPPRSLTGRIAWFVALWAGGVAALTLVGGAIKLMLL